VSDKPVREFPAGCFIGGIHQRRGNTYARLHCPDGELLVAATLGYISRQMETGHVESAVPAPAQMSDMGAVVQECLRLLQTPCTTIADTVAWTRWSEQLQARLRAFLTLNGVPA
jgi:hypothetical protein